MQNKLGNNTKTAKAPEGYVNFIMHLSPAKKVRQLPGQPQALEFLAKRLDCQQVTMEQIQKVLNANTCPWSGACAEYCLDTSGHGQRNSVQNARIAKTAHFYIDRENFILELQKEVAGKFKYHNRKGNKLAIRLNGTSDLGAYFMETIALFPLVQFYDYTKSEKMMERFLYGELPANYHLTFSYDRGNAKRAGYDAQLENFLKKGGNIAIIQEDYNDLVSYYPWAKQAPTIDGDEHDLRFLDGNQSAFVILQPKGKAKK